MRRFPAGAALLACAACASSPRTAPSGTPDAGRPPEAPPPPALAFTLAAPAIATYEFADTTNVTIEAGATRIDVLAEASVTSELELTPAADGLRATVRVLSVTGGATNSQGSGVTVDPADTPGPAQLAVSSTGEVTIVRKPEFASELQRIVAPAELYRVFFLRLPGRDVARGVAWTDTVAVSDSNQGLDSETTSIVTSVWERDTVVAGRTLNVITSRITTTASASGMADNVEIGQRMQGESTALTLWDPERHVIVERHARGEATGTTDLPSMNVSSLPTTSVATTHLWLRSFR